MIPDSKLDFWIKNDYNVLFRGKHGVGKSSIILDAFARHKLNYLYFSAPTIDPWVDFIGIPKETVDPKTGLRYLDLIRPKMFAADQVQAIFFDEFNRAPKKIRNAVMELIQFKSINGMKFENLKLVWTAINPEDDEESVYDVERLDPAQKDRFHILYDIPYKPDARFFKEKYGAEMANATLDWWKDCDKPVQKEVSPRRLDYALDIYRKGGDIRDVLPSSANVAKLIQELNHGSFARRLQEIYEKQDTKAAREFLSNENNFANTQKKIIGQEEYTKFFIPCLAEEKLIALMEDKKVFDIIRNDPNPYMNVLNNVVKANRGSALARNIFRTIGNPELHLSQMQMEAAKSKPTATVGPEEVALYKTVKRKSLTDSINNNFDEYHLNTKYHQDWDKHIQQLKEITTNAVYETTQEKAVRAYGTILNYPKAKASKEDLEVVVKYLYKLIETSQEKTYNGKLKSFKPLFIDVHANLNAFYEKEGVTWNIPRGVKVCAFIEECLKNTNEPTYPTGGEDTDE